MGDHDREETSELSVADALAEDDRTGGPPPSIDGRDVDGLTETAAEAYCPACERSYPAGVTECPVDGARLIPLVAGAEDADLTGHVVDGRFVIHERLGAGAMGTVYRAVQKTFDREVAIKLIERDRNPEFKATRRFLREARLASQLNHVNVVVVHDCGQDGDGSLYLVMELVAGRTLRDILDETGPLPLDRILRVGLQLCDALEAAHTHPERIIHRDLKPGNIMILDAPPGRDLVKVLDFGLAKALDSESTSLTRTDAIVGTPQYMPPELIKHEDADERSDLYALGCVLYAMAAGHPPFHRGTLHQVLAAHALVEPPAIERADLGGLPAVIDSLLRKDRAARPASAADVRDRLVAVAAATGSAQGAATRGKRSRRRLGILVLALLAIAGASFAIGSLSRRGPSSPSPSNRVSARAADAMPAPPSPREADTDAADAGVERRAGGADAAAIVDAAPAAAVAQDAAADAEPRLVTLTFRVTPRDARVELDGVDLGRAPRRHRLPASERAVTAVFRLRGFRTVRRRITLDRDRVIRVTLTLDPDDPS